MADNRGVAIRTAENLPVIVTDMARVELVLMNLVSNAIKYSDPAKPDRFVEVFLSGATDDGRTICIRDNGIGVPADDVPRTSSRISSAPVRKRTPSWGSRAPGSAWQSSRNASRRSAGGSRSPRSRAKARPSTCGCRPRPRPRGSTSDPGDMIEGSCRPFQSFAPAVLAEIIRRQPASKAPHRVRVGGRRRPALARVTTVELRNHNIIVCARDVQWARELERARDTILPRLQMLLGRDTVKGLYINA